MSFPRQHLSLQRGFRANRTINFLGNREFNSYHLIQISECAYFNSKPLLYIPMSEISAESNPSESRLPEWLEVVFRNTSKLRFGSVQILVHDGRVTQVERIQKTRFSPSPDARHAVEEPVELS